MGKRADTTKSNVTIPMVLLGLFALVVVISILTRGSTIQLLSPKGKIAHDEFNLIRFSVLTMLSLGIPTLALFYYFAWKYRDTDNVTYPVTKTEHGKYFVPMLWVIPSIFVVILGSTMWPAAHTLDQHRLIASNKKPLTIQVIALRWKWLFIYPDQNIATVNYIQIPVGTPVQFLLTADETPMSSFWIPQLGGQLYAMTGHENLINLEADTEGTYVGQSAEINGAGFAGMKFSVHATSQSTFTQWTRDVSRTTNPLTTTEYDSVATPSEDTPSRFYSTVDPNIYDSVLAKYAASHQHNTELQ
jgi:cytochrome o ubiquinol oxidase subunit II